VVLYLWDDADSYLRCATGSTAAELEDAISQYELGNASFAADGTIPGAQSLAPYSLLLAAEPELSSLTVSAGLSDTSQLLTALGFPSNTPNRYSSGNAEVVVESSRTLRIYTDGTVVYSGGGDATLSVKAAGETPTAAEAATGVTALLSGLLPGSSAQFYLESLQQSGRTTSLCFGYQLGGIPIRFADGSAAAEVTLTGTSVSAISLRLRQYTEGEAAPLLPLRQALAIAAQEQGAELSIGYIDDGSGTAAPGWLLDE
jgi:hypothetical protein